MSTLQCPASRVPFLHRCNVDVPPPAPDVVPTYPTPHPMPPGAPPEIPPLERPPEIIEPPEPGEHTPVHDPIVPGDPLVRRAARFPSARWRWPWH